MGLPWLVGNHKTSYSGRTCRTEAGKGTLNPPDPEPSNSGVPQLRDFYNPDPSIEFRSLGFRTTVPFFNSQVLLRFLLARQCHVEEALAMLRSVLEWRQQKLSKVRGMHRVSDISGVSYFEGLLCRITLFRVLASSSLRSPIWFFF